MPISTAEEIGSVLAPAFRRLPKIPAPQVLAAAILGGLILAPATGRAQDAGGGGIAGGLGGTTPSLAPDTSASIVAPIGSGASVLPATGFGTAPPDVRVGDLASQLGQTQSGTTLQASQRPWNIGGFLSVGQEYLSGGETGLNGNQFVTIIQPGIQAQANTSRLQAQIFYDPQIEIYSPDSSQDQVAQNLNGRALATLIPQTLFLDMRGTASVESAASGEGRTQNTVLSRGNSAQTYNFSVSPYLMHRFGDLGTGEVGGVFARTMTNTLSNSNAFLSAATNQQTTTTGGHVAFVTGEAFGRYNSAALGQVTRFDGTGPLHGAYRDTATLDNGYALTHTITVLGMIGWEDIHYGGTNPLHINDAIWNAGARYTPNPDSTVTLRYGRHDGRNAFTLDAAVAPTARLHLYARYSSGLSTDAEQLQTMLATSDLDAAGNPVDHFTGAPLLPIGDFFGLQNNLTRTTQASVTASLLYERDMFSFGVSHQDSTLVSATNAIGASRGDTHGTYGTLTWSHDLRPDLSSSISLEQGVEQDDGPPSFNTRLTMVSASLAYAFSPTLTSSASFSYNRRSGGIPANSVLAALSSDRGSQSTFLVRLVKSFSD